VSLFVRDESAATVPDVVVEDELKLGWLVVEELFVESLAIEVSVEGVVLVEELREPLALVLPVAPRLPDAVVELLLGWVEADESVVLEVLREESAASEELVLVLFSSDCAVEEDVLGWVDEVELRLVSFELTLPLKEPLVLAEPLTEPLVFDDSELADGDDEDVLEGAFCDE